MRTLILTVALAAICAGCGTTHIPAPGVPSSAGGGADSTAAGFDVYANLGYPGSTTVQSPVRNERRISPAQAGESMQLVLGGGEINVPDPADDPGVKFINMQIEMALAERQGAEPDIAELIDVRLDGLRMALMQRLSELDERAKALVPFANLTSLDIEYMPVVIKTNGGDPSLIPADVVEASAIGIEKAKADAVKALD